MNKLRSIIVANRNFLLCYGFFFLVGLIFLLAQGKTASFLLLNPYHPTPLDYFFIAFTYLGDGIFAAAVIILLMVLRRWPQAWQLLIAFLLSALVAQILKNVFSMPRPREVFNHGEYAYFIEGITHHGFSSFPSGHSTSVFTLATMLAIFERNKKINVLYLLIAVAVGYSRIYLGQHFLTDVLMGSFLGVTIAILVHWILADRFRSRAAA
ncbi:MAG: phosphatase PAP2 family protein [Chitinophagaceae bacterium]|nr:phosphatase PAP2 family protein [Chitinophagaceae bacterium]